MSKAFDFEFKLSKSSIEGLVDNIKNFRKELKLAKNEILIELAEYTKKIVQKNIQATVGKGGYPNTQELENSIQISSILNDMIRVYTDLWYAKYVEFGTGIVGNHPKASQEGWTYDKNSHGEEGWTYQGSDGEYYWTQGEEAHMFMLNAYEEVEANYMTIVKSVLRKRGIID